MSDAAENIEDVFDTDNIVDDVVDNDTDKTELDDKPAPRGYMSKEAWIESGKPADEWVSEEVFKERGERIKQTSRLQKEHDNEIKNLKLLHQFNLKTQREELMTRRDNLIEEADKAGVKAIDKQLAELDKLDDIAKDTTAQSSKPDEVVAWEAANPWCNDPKDPRLALANRTYIAAVNAGSDAAEALELVDIALAKKFSTKSGNKNQIAESSRQSSTARSDSAVVTMKNLTRDEQKAWDSGLFDDEKAFLKAVANDRKGNK